MNTKDYIKNTAVTDLDSDGQQNMAHRCHNVANLLHYTIGVGTEAAELLDAVKKHIAYGKPLDLVNIKEETGDLLFYVARIIDMYGWTFEEVMETNINKLKARYGTKFSEAAALNRDLEAERKILEL
jgi:NTP pyrophosphatase (non-canonical NTP hydrolase)